jgi:hypothetical protein
MAETPEPDGSTPRTLPPLMSAAWEGATAEPDPLAALGATRALGRLLSTWESRLVLEAVAAGATWESIGESVGVSRQAAWERFHEEVHEFRQQVKTEARALRSRHRQEWNEFKDNVRSRTKEGRRRSH